MVRRVLGIVLAVGVGAALLQTGAGAGENDTGDRSVGRGRVNARTPTVTGPVTGGQGVPQLLSTNFEPSSVGYTRDEYFIEGEAVAYQPVGKLRANGRWTVEEASTAPFKTRIVVYKPSDPDDFNGTVYVEWLNVSAGFDTAPDWINAHNFIIREGAAWVGVSAQAVGVQGGADVLEGAAVGGLKGADPERYGTLTHPGDAFSFDIFTQAGVAASGEGDGEHPFASYDVQRIIALGESQSAFRLTTYVNAIQPLVGLYDGFFIHSRGGSAAPFGDSRFSMGDESIPDGARIRRDIDVPVLTFETETDLTRLGFAAARQPDFERFRLWEAAGTAHADSYTGTLGANDTGDGSAELEVLDPARASGGPLQCATPVNAGAQHAVVSAAIAALERWVRDGDAPPKAPRIETTGTGDAVAIVRDEHGIAIGGIRSPIVEVPLARNDGEENSGGSFCSLFGTTTPFDAATLAELYPNGSEEYVAKFERAADRIVRQGFWLEPDAENFKAAARQITFG